MAATSTATLYTTTTALPPTVVGTSAQERPKLSFRSAVPFTVDGVTAPISYTFEVSPNEVNLQRLSLSYAELERPGRRPLLLAKSPQLQQVSATVLVTALGPDRFFASCQPRIDVLTTFADLDVDLVVSYPGIPSTMTWRITDLSLRTVRRNEMNEVTIAEADITFTESVIPQSIVPGMAVIKDVPATRSTTGSGGSSSGGGGTTDCQKYSGDDQARRDVDTACRIKTIYGGSSTSPSTGISYGGVGSFRVYVS